MLINRSSTYCSDVGKMNGVPIVHVNGSRPEVHVHVSIYSSHSLFLFQGCTEGQ